jgi:hypothetical protein
MSIKNFGSKINHTGRPRGSKNRLNYTFLTALADDFEEHGPGTIRICRIEKPHEYLKIVAGLMPKEFEFTDNRLGELSDDELDAVITYTRGRLAAKRELAADVGGGEEPTAH